MDATTKTPKTSSPSPLAPSWVDKFDVFELRSKIHNSPFTGCAREAFMWSIGTGVTMGLHRMRMGSRSIFSVNVAFGTACLVCVPSYYFCVKNLEHRDKVIKLMMKANEFDSMDEAPETPKVDADHPFLEMVPEGEGKGLDKEFRMYKKDPKPWEDPQEGASFEEVKKTKGG